MAGLLYVVATPIGNMDDLSPRAHRVLSEVDFVAAEDTRTTALLFAEIGVRTPLLSCHEHNEIQRSGQIVQRLLAGETAAYVSDAGMPCISDPGEHLVRVCLEAGLTVRVIPGPNAALTALAASGFDTTRFVFEGFLPAKGKERRDRLQFLCEEPRTILLHEAPHRILRLLDELNQPGWAGRKLCLARELTKRYEEYLYGTAETMLDHYAGQEPRGGYVVGLEGREAWLARRPEQQAIERQVSLDEAEALLRAGIDAGVRLKQLVSDTAEKTGLPRNLLYQTALGIRRRDED